MIPPRGPAYIIIKLCNYLSSRYDHQYGLYLETRLIGSRAICSLFFFHFPQKLKLDKFFSKSCEKSCNLFNYFKTQESWQLFFKNTLKSKFKKIISLGQASLFTKCLC